MGWPSETTIGSILASGSQKLHDANNPSHLSSFNPSSQRIYLYECMQTPYHHLTATCPVSKFCRMTKSSLSKIKIDLTRRNEQRHIHPRVYVCLRMCTLLLLMLHLLLCIFALCYRLCTALPSSSTSPAETDARSHHHLQRCLAVWPIMNHRKRGTNLNAGQQERQSYPNSNDNLVPH